MSESEWLDCIDPDQMLAFLRARGSDRQMQLCASAFCRRLSGLLPNAMIRKVTEACDRDADRLADLDELLEIQQQVGNWFRSHGFGIGRPLDKQGAETILEWSGSATQELSRTHAEKDAAHAVATLIQTQPIGRIACRRFGLSLSHPGAVVAKSKW